MEQDSLVVVVDDDERICRSVERVLVNDGFRVRTFPSAQRYLAEQSWLEPDCLIIDIRLSDADGLTMLRESRAAGLEAPAIFITGTADLTSAVKAMKLGAIDLLEKPLDERTLLDAVHHAIQVGLEWRTARERLAALWRALDTLTPREAEVCALVATGRLNKQIAAIIGTTEKTVKVHRARAMAKLGAHSVAELVRAVDDLLEAGLPTTIFTSDHHVVHSPAALAVMRKALERDTENGTLLRRRSGSIPERSSESFDSAGHPPAIESVGSHPDA